MNSFSASQNGRNSLETRAARLVSRSAALSPLAGGRLAAAVLILRMRRDLERIHTVVYNRKPVHFRTPDETALHEVLVLGEYGFLAGALRAIERPKVLDVGTHIGTFAMWLAGVAPDAKVLCVEADPATHRLAEKNVAAHLPSATVLQRAGGSNDSDVLRLSVDGPSMSHRVAEAGGVDVRSISLSTLIDQVAGPNGRVDLAKIDIEGSEERLLCARPEALSAIDSLVIELHPTLCDAVKVRELLEQHYRSVIEVGDRISNKPLLYCVDNVVFAPR